MESHACSIKCRSNWTSTEINIGKSACCTKTYIDLYIAKYWNRICSHTHTLTHLHAQLSTAYTLLYFYIYTIPYIVNAVIGYLMMADGSVIFIGSKWKRNRTEQNRNRIEPNRAKQASCMDISNVVIIYSS